LKLDATPCRSLRSTAVPLCEHRCPNWPRHLRCDSFVHCNQGCRGTLHPWLISCQPYRAVAFPTPAGVIGN
jgi:hypothetical protein